MLAERWGIFWGGGCDQSTTPTIVTPATITAVRTIAPISSETAAL